MKPWVHYEFAECSIRSDERVVRHRGKALALAPKAVDVLLILLEHAGEVVPKQEFMERIWPETFVEESNLNQYVHLLRRAFAQCGSRAEIATIARVGYRFDCAVRVRHQTETVGVRTVATRFRLGLAIAPAVALALGIVLVFGARGGWFSKPGAGLDEKGQRSYALGRYALEKPSHDGALQSLAYFREVTREAPRSPLGFSGLADAYTMLTFGETPEQSARDKADALLNAERAVALDPGSAEAQTSLGAVDAFLRQDERAAQLAFRKAIALDPNYAAAHMWYGDMLATQGRLAASRDQFERAVDLGPFDSAPVQELAWDYYLLHDYSAAEAFCEEVLAVAPENAGVAYVLALTDEQTRRHDEAAKIFKRLARIPEQRVRAFGGLAEIYARSGNKRLALRMIALLKTAAARSTVSPFTVGIAFAAVGEQREAWNWLGQVPQEQRRWFDTDPRLDRLRGDPNFARWQRLSSS